MHHIETICLLFFVFYEIFQRVGSFCGKIQTEEDQTWCNAVWCRQSLGQFEASGCWCSFTKYNMPVRIVRLLFLTPKKTQVEKNSGFRRFSKNSGRKSPIFGLFYYISPAKPQLFFDKLRFYMFSNLPSCGKVGKRSSRRRHLPAWPSWCRGYPRFLRHCGRSCRLLQDAWLPWQQQLTDGSRLTSEINRRETRSFRETTRGRGWRSLAAAEQKKIS